MSDQSPSGSFEPQPPTPSDAPDDPMPGQPVAPGQPGFGAYGGQYWGPYPADPAGQPQGWAWPPAGGPVRR